jgi:hypothetical protein
VSTEKSWSEEAKYKKKSFRMRFLFLFHQTQRGAFFKNNLYKTAFRKREKRRKIAAHARIFQAETAAEIKSQHA